LGFWSGIQTLSSVMCGAESQAGEALRRIGLVMKLLGLTLHPAKTRRGLQTREREFRFLGRCDSQEAEHLAFAGQALYATVTVRRRPRSFGTEFKS
jgi:hypothetical protein